MPHHYDGPRYDSATRTGVTGRRPRLRVHRCARCRLDVTTPLSGVRPEGWEALAFTGLRVDGQGFAVICRACAADLAEWFRCPPKKIREAASRSRQLEIEHTKENEK